MGPSSSLPKSGDFGLRSAAVAGGGLTSPLLTTRVSACPLVRLLPQPSRLITAAKLLPVRNCGSGELRERGRWGVSCRKGKREINQDQADTDSDADIVVI